MKEMTSFRLSHTTKDDLQECLNLLRRANCDDGLYWRKLNRTDILELAIANFLAELRKDRESRDLLINQVEESEKKQKRSRKLN